jgi:hypothetical protein
VWVQVRVWPASETSEVGAGVWVQVRVWPASETSEVECWGVRVWPASETSEVECWGVGSGEGVAGKRD